MRLDNYICYLILLVKKIKKVLTYVKKYCIISFVVSILIVEVK